MNIAEIEGIGPAYVEKLARAGIRTPLALLKNGHSAKLRKQLSQATGISERLILDWVNFADLLRIEGIGAEYANLLEEIGVDSSRELAVRNAKTLARQIKEVNREKNLVRKLPSLEQITRAIRSAADINHLGAHGLAGTHTTPAPPPKKPRGPIVSY